MSQPEPATTGTALTSAAQSGTEVGSVFVSNYPPYSFWREEGLPAVHEALDAPPRPADTLGIYLHIPFCRRRCKFCYFRVFTDKNAEQIETYVETVIREAELLGQRAALAGRPADFVYFGGGTPSYISVKHLERLVEGVQQHLPWQPREFAFECEPGTLTRSKLEAIKGIGVTRLSLGVEHFNDDILRENGRAHVSKEIYRVLPWVEEMDFDQVNIDLIAGMVGDTWETWREAVAKTLEVGPDSVTIYQMELPYNTVYSQGILEGGATPVADWPTKRAWQEYAIEQLGAAGYEVSSAYTMVKKKPGREQESAFLYRDALWQGADLLGLGVSSFSHFGGVHYQNQAGWTPYLEAVAAGELPLSRAYVPTREERLTREVILQLKRGFLERRPFADKFEVDIFEHFAPAFAALERRGMVELGPERAELTRAGLLRVDQLLPEFYDEKYRNARYT